MTNLVTDIKIAIEVFQALKALKVELGFPADASPLEVLAQIKDMAHSLHSEVQDVPATPSLLVSPEVEAGINTLNKA